jgi:DNA-binding XRE family transcriptional regulator
MTKEEIKDKLAKFIRKHPELTYLEIAKKVGISESSISAIARESGVNRRKGGWKKNKLTEQSLANL